MQDNTRPWPEGVHAPWEVRRAAAAGVERRLSPRRSISPPRSPRLSAIHADDSIGAGSDEVRLVLLKLATAVEELDSMRTAIAEEGDGQFVAPAEAEFLRTVKMCNFLCQGGNIPEGLELQRYAFCAGGFVKEVPKFVGGFLITRYGTGPPRPRRALFAIRGTLGGRLALQRLPALGAGDERDIRKLAMPEPAAPGGWVADPVAVLKWLRPVLPTSLIEWANLVLQGEAAVCHSQTSATLAELRAVNQLRLEAAERKARYEARAPWRHAMQARRGPLVKELWAALWSAETGRLQSVFFAMERVGMTPKDKIFHEVAVQSEDGAGEVHYIVLEPAGATNEEADVVVEDGGVRRHSQATALDAYLCMRSDDGAPGGNNELLKWLTQNCPPPSRSSFSAEHFQRCPGRHMMLGKEFVKLALSDLMKDAQAIKIPGEEEEEDAEPRLSLGRIESSAEESSAAEALVEAPGDAAAGAIAGGIGAAGAAGASEGPHGPLDEDGRSQEQEPPRRPPAQAAAAPAAGDDLAAMAADATLSPSLGTSEDDADKATREAPAADEAVAKPPSGGDRGDDAHGLDEAVDECDGEADMPEIPGEDEEGMEVLEDGDFGDPTAQSAPPGAEATA